MPKAKEVVKLGEGWGFPLNSRKAHFFTEDARSLCGGWMFFGKLENDRHDHQDNCRSCMTKRLARESRQNKIKEKQ